MMGLRVFLRRKKPLYEFLNHSRGISRFQDSSSGLWGISSTTNLLNGRQTFTRVSPFGHGEYRVGMVRYFSTNHEPSPEEKKEGFTAKINHCCLSTRLLWAHVRMKLLRNFAWGKSLSRRERQHRTTADFFWLVPFMEFMLPVFMKFFSSMLPSTFKMEEQEALRRNLNARTEYAKLHQETVKEKIREVKDSRNVEIAKTAEDLSEFMGKVRKCSSIPNDNCFVPKPPRPRKEPKVLENFGDIRIDYYYWLRDDTHSRNDVLSYLTKENEYAEAIMFEHKPIINELYNEMIGRIQENEMTLPVRLGSYYYYEKYMEGGEYWIHCRRRALGNNPSIYDVMGTGPDTPEEIVFDFNELGLKYSYIAWFLRNIMCVDDGKQV